ncbi:hypothetical protein HAX54_037490, partial [Datura stramonium]|nr:hypothetical protein [Datura stramonium]
HLGTTTIRYSPVRFGETPMIRQFRVILASGHCPDPASHWHFVERDRRFADLSS